MAPGLGDRALIFRLITSAGTFHVINDSVLPIF